MPEARRSAVDDSVLDRIMREMMAELPSLQAATPLDALERRAGERPAPRDFRTALLRPGLALVAEVKKGSPSKGPFAEGIDPVQVARAYRDAGAVAISVLTSRYFFARDADLDTVASALNADESVGGPATPPLLRKEFHFDPYQVVEARALGADAFLLIAKTLDTSQLRDLIATGATLSMTAFVEVTDEAEMASALKAGATVLGINNRDLHTFEEDLSTTERIRPLIPNGVVVVAASGIRSRDDLARMRACDVQAVLIGEALITAPDPQAKIRELFHD